MTWADLGSLALAALQVFMLIRIQHQYRPERQK